MDDKDFKLIFSPQLAKHLILAGYTVVDLKQKRENSESTIFIFKRSDGLLSEIEKWKLNKIQSA
jgi:hypothetical protein